MIELKDLKIGDKVYKINKYYWCKEIEITEEIREFEYQDLSKSTVYVVVGKSLEECGKHREQLFYYDEINLFRTEDEAKRMMDVYRNKQKVEWSNKDNLIRDMFERLESNLTLADRKLIREIISEKED